MAQSSRRAVAARMGERHPQRSPGLTPAVAGVGEEQAARFRFSEGAGAQLAGDQAAEERGAEWREAAERFKRLEVALRETAADRRFRGQESRQDDPFAAVV